MIIECFQPPPAEGVFPSWSTTAVTASICGLTAGNEWQSTDLIYKYTISDLKFNSRCQNILLHYCLYLYLHMILVCLWKEKGNITKCSRNLLIRQMTELLKSYLPLRA